MKMNRQNEKLSPSVTHFFSVLHTSEDDAFYEALLAEDVDYYAGEDGHEGGGHGHGPVGSEGTGKVGEGYGEGELAHAVDVDYLLEHVVPYLDKEHHANYHYSRSDGGNKDHPKDSHAAGAVD